MIVAELTLVGGASDKPHFHFNIETMWDKCVDLVVSHHDQHQLVGGNVGHLINNTVIARFDTYHIK